MAPALIAIDCCCTEREGTQQASDQGTGRRAEQNEDNAGGPQQEDQGQQ
jgi:hypothetical protein